MRKIERENENPIDNILIYLCDIMSEPAHQLGLTPNMITTLSLLFGLVTVYALYRRKYAIACILWIISYFFDCLDGFVARKYKQYSKFGDWYDHTSDVFKVTAILYVLYRISSVKFWRIIWILVFFGILMLSFFGCQEKLYDKDESESLAMSKYLCPNCYFKDIPSTLQYMKYFGCGTLTMVLILCFLYYGYTP